MEYAIGSRILLQIDTVETDTSLRGCILLEPLVGRCCPDTAVTIFA